MELREFWTELPSTQTLAIRRAREGVPEGTRIVARRQNGGYGRLDHRWASPEGGLYLSVVLRPSREVPPLLPLAVGALLRREFEVEYGVRSVLRWPNDLLVLGSGRPRKLAGVLVDALTTPTLGPAVVVGIGVNVSAPASAYPIEIRERVVGLSELVSPGPTLDEVEVLGLRAASGALAELQTSEGAADLLGECRRALHGIGRQATVDRSVTGVIRSLGSEGELWLDTPHGARAVVHGELVVEGDL